MTNSEPYPIVKYKDGICVETTYSDGDKKYKIEDHPDRQEVIEMLREAQFRKKIKHGGKETNTLPKCEGSIFLITIVILIILIVIIYFHLRETNVLPKYAGFRYIGASYLH